MRQANQPKARAFAVEEADVSPIAGAGVELGDIADTGEAAGRVARHCDNEAGAGFSQEISP